MLLPLICCSLDPSYIYYAKTLVCVITFELLFEFTWKFVGMCIKHNAPDD